MAGESESHADISVNLVRELSNQLRGTLCRVWTKDVKIRCGPEPTLQSKTKGLYAFPDLTVVCGKRQYHDQYKDVLLNPAVLVEVLSPSTESFDRGEKWLRYQTWLPTLMNYILVSQTAPQIEQYSRQTNGEWIYSFVEGLDREVHLSSIDCTLKLADVYDRVIFPEPELPTDDEP
jgi:Uma2 family endonuclease